MRNNLTVLFQVAFLIFLSACSSTELNQPTSDTPENSETSIEIANFSSDDTEESSSLECANKELFCIGLVSSTGDLQDNPYSRLAWEALKRAETDLRAETDFIIAKNTTEFPENIARFADEDFDVIITVGHAIHASTIDAAYKYPNTNFIGVDQDLFTYLDNAVWLSFPEYESGFLAGVLAATATQTGIVGAVLGSGTSKSIVNFKKGFEDGVQSVRSDIDILTIYYPGTIEASTADPEWGVSTAQRLLVQGADVIIATDGATGNSALIEVATNSKAFCIGVGSDKWLDVPDARPCLLSSAIYEIENGVFELIARSALEKMPVGDFYGKVKLAPYHSFEEVFSAEVKAFLKQASQDLDQNHIPLDGSHVFKDPPTLSIAR